MSGDLINQKDIWDDSELIKMYEESLNPTHSEEASDETERKVSLLNQQSILYCYIFQWKVGDECMAIFEEDGKCYHAKILGVNIPKKTAKVLYTEYDQTAVVPLKELYGEDEVQYLDEQGEDEELDDVSNESVKEKPSTSTNRQIPLPTVLPPPPELFKNVTNESEITSNMMLSWYMSGYHTGYFQAMRDFQKTSSKPKR